MSALAKLEQVSIKGQRHESGLKSGEIVDSGQKYFDFYRQIFTGKFPKNFDFFRQFKKNSIFQATIGHLQLLLGKLFYFPSKVTASWIDAPVEGQCEFSNFARP